MSAFIPIYPLAAPSSGSTTLAELTDVEFTSLANAEMLAFNATSGKWENIPAPTGTGSVTNVSGTAPIQVVTGTTTPIISIDAATTSAAGSMSSADKTKLDGIAAGANNYTHPANHAPSIITQDASNRFVTDAEIAAWNAKQAALVSGTNIKTINSTSILGSGDIVISGSGSAWGAITGTLTDQTDLNTALAAKEDTSNKNASSGYAGLSLYKIVLTNNAGTKENYLTCDTTGNRYYTFPNKNITVAGLDDITGINSGTNTGDQTTITGNAGSATVLQTARTINGVSFNGSANITINAVDSTARIASSEKGAASGICPLDSGSKVAATYLPAYVDDVLEYANLAALPGTGTAGIIYVTLDTNKTYRWSGSAYTEISPSPGSTDSVTEGSNNLYFTVARVRAVILTGLSLATNAVIAATDTVLEALGKLQAQITSHVGNTSNPHSVTKAQIIASGSIVQADLGANVAGNGPAFKATRTTSNQSLSAGNWNIVKVNAATFNTNASFDTVNYRFKPTVAGYYQLNGVVTLSAGVAAVGIGVNGALPLASVGWGGSAAAVEATSLVYLNGTTDYVQLYVYPSTAASITTNNNTYLQGFLARAA